MESRFLSSSYLTQHPRESMIPRPPSRAPPRPPRFPADRLWPPLPRQPKNHPPRPPGYPDDQPWPFVPSIFEPSFMDTNLSFWHDKYIPFGYLNSHQDQDQDQDQDQWAIPPPKRKDPPPPPGFPANKEWKWPVINEIFDPSFDNPDRSCWKDQLYPPVGNLIPWYPPVRRNKNYAKGWAPGYRLRKKKQRNINPDAYPFAQTNPNNFPTGKTTFTTMHGPFYFGEGNRFCRQDDIDDELDEEDFEDDNDGNLFRKLVKDDIEEELKRLIFRNPILGENLMTRFGNFEAEPLPGKFIWDYMMFEDEEINKEWIEHEDSIWRILKPQFTHVIRQAYKHGIPAGIILPRFLHEAFKLDEIVEEIQSPHKQFFLHLDFPEGSATHSICPQTGNVLPEACYTIEDLIVSFTYTPGFSFTDFYRNSDPNPFFALEDLQFLFGRDDDMFDQDLVGFLFNKFKMQTGETKLPMDRLVIFTPVDRHRVERKNLQPPAKRLKR